MKEKVLRVLKLLPYPAFYVFCLFLFGYVTFPFDRLKDRILSEIAKQSKGAKSAPTVTMEHLDSYWLTGVEVENVKVRIPADPSPPKGGFGAFGMGAKSEPDKDAVIDVREAHARARILPLLIGRVQLDFWASVFGGEVSGTAPAGTSKGDVELKIEDAKLSEVEMLQSLLGIPVDGKINGSLSLSPVDGKFAKANGKVDLSVKGFVAGDGKAKVMGMLAIPAAKIDDLVISGEAEKGVLKITKLSAPGPDIEIDGDGKITLKENLGDSQLDLYVKFRFTDAYRGKDGTTKSILGEPGSASTPLIDSTVPQLKKAKRADGFYGFHIHGRLKKPDFTPSPTDASGSGGTPTSPKRPGKGDVTMSPGGKKLGGIANMPLGPSTVAPDDKKEEEQKKEEKPEERRNAMPMPMPMPPPMMNPPPPREPPPQPPPQEDPVVPNAPPQPPGDSPPPGDNQPPSVAPPGGDSPPPDQPQQPPTEDVPR
ncbi:MAG: type II secretion system protein GspN [Polyangiaceae bacterium]